ncbi:MAG: ABC transporter permease [Anaerolineae bacterium]|nr:ABC transporter permease [Anaerolineae bacterium]
MTIWLAATLAFFALRLLPGDALEAQLSQSGASLSVIQQRRTAQGLTDSIWVQYLHFITNLAQGDLGYSLLQSQSVLEMVSQRLQPTATLALCALIIASISGVALGIVGVFHLGWGISTSARLLTTLALSMPVYWSGTLAILIFSGVLNNLPVHLASNINNLVMPAAVLGFHTAGAIAQITASNLRQVLHSDFIRTAHAKGLPKRIIIRRHILRVGLLPTISIISLQAGFLLSGTVIVESIFVRPGIGRLLFDSVLQQDYPVVQGIAILVAAIYVALNTLAEGLYMIVDPRVNM